MGNFDMAIGLDGASVNQLSAAVYRQLYPKLFKGSENVTFEGIDLTLEYDVKAAPVFVLRPPPDARTLIANHLDEHGIGDTSRWQKHERLSAIAEAIQDNVFQVRMDQFFLTIDSGDGEPVTIRLDVNVAAQANSAGGKLSLLPLKAYATADNPADQAIVNMFILPKAMEMMTTLLSGLSLPALSVPGIELTPPALFVLNDRLIALANLLGGPVPTPPFPGNWPTSPFFALVGPPVRQRIAQLASGNIRWSGSKSGSVGTSIGGASYGASAAITNARVDAPPGPPTDFAAAIDVGGNVSAEVTVACIPVGVNYSLKPDHAPITVRISAAVSNLNVIAVVQDISSFTIILVPNGSVLEKILSAITWPITQAVVAAFSPQIIGAIRGIAIPVMQVPSFPYSVEGVYLNLVPVQLGLGSWGDHLAVMGQVSIT